VFVPALAGTKAVLELLEHSSAFLPARVPSEQRGVVLNKDTVVWLALPGDDREDELYEFRHDVRLELVGGGELAGELLYSLPHDHARVVDYLNGPSRFARLFTGGRLFLVNKAYLERVVEVPIDLNRAPGAERADEE
jgi:hypothetical protein